MPTMLKIGFSEAAAYRAEMLVWVFATTMPLIMLMVWTAVSEVAPVPSVSGRTWGTGSFVAYFLSAFIVRQLISSWAAWEINYEVRQGTLSMRLLRPVHPVLMYLVQNLAFMPLRFAVTAPVVVILLVSPGGAHLEKHWATWLVFLASLAGGWMINFFANIAIGALSFTMESSVKIMDVWLAAFFVFSGYLFPLDLFPPWLREVSAWLPFRYQLGLPVELMTGVHELPTALTLLARQLAWAAAFLVGSLALWRAGVKRFQAYGG
ncbi:MAG: ABC-2 family transporter protein [Myxococcales bacterium]|nr:ABC-2 family transporter protein [Myxococcales bacterium]